MLSIARHPFAVNPNPDLEEVARARNWTVYFPASKTEGLATGFRQESF